MLQAVLFKKATNYLTWINKCYGPENHYVFTPLSILSNYVYIHNLSLLNRFHDDSKNIVIALRIILWYLLKVLLFEKVSKFKKKHATVPFRWLRVVGTIFFWLIAYLKTARSTRLSMNGMSNTIFGLWQPYDRLAFNKRKLLCSPRLNPGMKNLRTF